VDFVTLAGLLIAFSSVFLANWLGGGESSFLLLNLPSANYCYCWKYRRLVKFKAVFKRRYGALVLIKWSLFPPIYDFNYCSGDI